MVYLPSVWREVDRATAPVFGSWHPLLRQIDELFNEVVAPTQGTRADSQASSFNPTFELEEASDHYLLTADVPGVAKDDLSIELKDNQLLIAGERKHEESHKTGQTTRRSRSYGRFQRVLGLPEGIKPEDIEAQYKDGVLRVMVKKPAETKAAKIAIGEAKGGFLKNILGDKKAKDTVDVKSEPTAMAN